MDSISLNLKVLANPLPFIQEEIFPRRLLQVNLIQQSVSGHITLCHFVISLAELSRHSQSTAFFGPELKKGWAELLLTPTWNFPGILAPKLELCSEVHFEEIIGGQFSRVILLPLLFEKNTMLKHSRHIIHQRVKQDKKDKSVWSNQNQNKPAKPVLIPKSHVKNPSFRKVSSCPSVDQCEHSPSGVRSPNTGCPSGVCQCPICTRFDSVFPPGKRVFNRSVQTSSIQCHTQMRTCHVPSENRPNAEPVTTSNVSHTKSNIALRDKEAFKLYAKSLSDVCPIHTSSQKRSQQVVEELSYHPQLFSDNNVYFTSQWKHMNDMNKSSRYLFYAKLENFYRQLYTRAKAKTVTYAS